VTESSPTRSRTVERDLLKLNPGVAQMPSETGDREALVALWPLLAAGSPRTLLVGKLVVGLGLDSSTASHRLDGVLGELASRALLRGA
jgi:hypothetical protein